MWLRMCAICLNSINTNWIRHAVCRCFTLASFHFISFRLHSQFSNIIIIIIRNYTRNHNGKLGYARYASSSRLYVYFVSATRAKSVIHIEKRRGQLVEWQMAFSVSASWLFVAHSTFIFVVCVLDFLRVCLPIFHFTLHFECVYVCFEL